MSKKFDVFIAYHGTYEEGGSCLYASKIADFLINKGISVFFYPYSKRDSYKTNIFEVINSQMFLLVCNNGIHRNEQKKINYKNHYELNVELDSFYSSTFLDNDEAKSVLDSKVVFCGHYDENFRKGDEALLHELFKDRVHFEFNHQDPNASFEEIYQWVLERKRGDSYLDSRLSTEVQKVYAKRKAMIDGEKFNDKIALAKKILCIGISNSDLTTRIDEDALNECLKHGGEVEMYFLDPDGKYTKIREHEEAYSDERIKLTTYANLNNALAFYDTLDGNLKCRYHFYFYDVSPRMNIMFIDDNLYLQFYGYVSRGLNTPSFVIARSFGNSPIYDYCMKSYQFIKSVSREINYGKRYYNY